MFRRLLLGTSIAIAILALFISQWATPSAPRTITVNQGRNNTILFLTNIEYGFSTVLVATADAILQHHPHIQVHFASFPSMGPRLKRISTARKPARDIIFHELPDRSYITVGLERPGITISDIVHPPGPAGISTVCRDMPFFVSPWSGEDHFTLFRAFTGTSQYYPSWRRRLIMLTSKFFCHRYHRCSRSCCCCIRRISASRYRRNTKPQ